MGANSAKAMRGGGMDDVIFAGSGGRPVAQPRRGGADHRQRRPARPGRRSTTDPVLEVVRRIDRGEGSTYRVNGREVRARDVQLLFADASTGANSPALVRQGQISRADRRQAAEPPADPGRGGRGLRPAHPPPRGRAAPARRRGQSRAAGRRGPRAGAATWPAEARGAPGRALQEPVGRDPRPAGRVLLRPLDRGARRRRARRPPRPPRRISRWRRPPAPPRLAARAAPPRPRRRSSRCATQRRRRAAVLHGWPSRRTAWTASSSGPAPRSSACTGDLERIAADDARESARLEDAAAALARLDGDRRRRRGRRSQAAPERDAGTWKPRPRPPRPPAPPPTPRSSAWPAQLGGGGGRAPRRRRGGWAKPRPGWRARTPRAGPGAGGARGPGRVADGPRRPPRPAPAGRRARGRARRRPRRAGRGRGRPRPGASRGGPARDAARRLQDAAGRLTAEARALAGLTAAAAARRLRPGPRRGLARTGSTKRPWPPRSATTSTPRSTAPRRPSGAGADAARAGLAQGRDAAGRPGQGAGRSWPRAWPSPPWSTAPDGDPLAGRPAARRAAGLARGRPLALGRLHRARRRAAARRGAAGAEDPPGRGSRPRSRR